MELLFPYSASQHSHPSVFSVRRRKPHQVNDVLWAQRINKVLERSA